MDKKEFKNAIREGALKGQKEYGILPSLTMAQAILESGWGSSQLALRANNLFGIKAFSNWKGRRITLPTTEWYNSRMIVVNAEFRAYDSFDDSIEDHNRLLADTRYKPVRECRDYKTACRSIKECGYATDPGYPQKLIRIIEENRLYELDSPVLLKEVSADMDREKIRGFQVLCIKLNIRDYEGKALLADNKLGPRTESCIINMPVLKTGDRGSAVEFVQAAINITPSDGVFGPITKQCVIRYQIERNLKADGIVGFQTWKAIVMRN